MKQVFGCFGIFVAIALIFLILFEKAITKPPAALRPDTEGSFDTPEEVLDTYVWAYNNRDYFTYLECLGKSTEVTMTNDVDYEVKLWGQISDYEIERRTRSAKLVKLRVRQDFTSAGGDFSSSKTYRGQLVDYYFIQRDRRWVYVPESLELTIEIAKNTIWSIWEK